MALKRFTDEIPRVPTKSNKWITFKVFRKQAEEEMSKNVAQLFKMLEITNNLDLKQVL